MIRGNKFPLGEYFSICSSKEVFQKVVDSVLPIHVNQCILALFQKEIIEILGGVFLTSPDLD